jgi:hypothetical protein
MEVPSPKSQVNFVGLGDEVFVNVRSWFGQAVSAEFNAKLLLYGVTVIFFVALSIQPRLLVATSVTG